MKYHRGDVTVQRFRVALFTHFNRLSSLFANRSNHSTSQPWQPVNRWRHTYKPRRTYSKIDSRILINRSYGAIHPIFKIHSKINGQTDSKGNQKRLIWTDDALVIVQNYQKGKSLFMIWLDKYFWLTSQRNCDFNGLFARWHHKTTKET